MEYRRKETKHSRYENLIDPKNIGDEETYIIKHQKKKIMIISSLFTFAYYFLIFTYLEKYFQDNSLLYTFSFCTVIFGCTLYIYFLD